MSYRQISGEERVIIATLHGQGFSNARIGKELGRHRSTIWREVQRNRTPHDGFYRARRAHERTVARRRRSRRNQRFDGVQMARVDALLRGQWSPEQVSGHLRRAGELSISHETIYRHVWRDRRAGGSLHEHLRGARKQRRKRYGHNDSRGRLAGKRLIGERPASIESRQWVGHWDIDTVLGTTSECVMTLVERATGFTLIGKMAARTVAELNRTAIEMIRRYPGRFQSITADNGTEFHGYKDIEAATGVIFYFATPHHSWERGTNENTNGLIRQYLPKRQSMEKLRQKQCDTIAETLNERPRKRYDYKTPNQCFYAK
jgi:IS30 family transposase